MEMSPARRFRRASARACTCALSTENVEMGPHPKRASTALLIRSYRTDPALRTMGRRIRLNAGIRRAHFSSARSTGINLPERLDELAALLQRCAGYQVHVTR